MARGTARIRGTAAEPQVGKQALAAKQACKQQQRVCTEHRVPAACQRATASLTCFRRVPHAQQDEQAHGCAHDAGRKHPPLPAVHLWIDRQGPPGQASRDCGPISGCTHPGGPGNKPPPPSKHWTPPPTHTLSLICARTPTHPPLLPCPPGWVPGSRPCCVRCSTCPCSGGGGHAAVISTYRLAGEPAARTRAPQQCPAMRRTSTCRAPWPQTRR